MAEKGIRIIKYCILAMGLVGSNYPMKADVMTVARSFSSHNLNHHTMQEIWKDIPNYEGIYQVSTLGTVKSLSRFIVKNNGQKYPVKEKILNNKPLNNGYIVVCLKKNLKRERFSVHQLMAIAFLDHTPNGHKIVVDHIDNNKLNNRLSNLQLVTHRENSSKDRWRKNPLSKYVGVSITKQGSIRAIISIENKDVYLGTFNTEIEASVAYKKKLLTLNL